MCFSNGEETKIIELHDEVVKKLFKQGITRWFQIGLNFSSKNSWKGEFWILEIIDKKKFLLAKIKYGF